MTIFNGGGNLNAGVIVGQATSALKAHRQALEVLNDLYAWSSGVAVADLEAAPYSMSAADAQALLGAIADAHAEYLLHTTGLPPATYPQPPQAYVYAASQNQVIGPQLCRSGSKGPRAAGWKPTGKKARR